MAVSRLDYDALDLIEADFVVTAIIELRRARRGMVRQSSCLFKRAAAPEARSDYPLRAGVSRQSFEVELHMVGNTPASFSALTSLFENGTPTSFSQGKLMAA